MGEGKEFVGTSIESVIAEGADYYRVSEDRLKFSVLEEKTDPLTGEVTEIRVWIDRPDPGAVRQAAQLSEGSLKEIQSVVNQILEIANLELEANVIEREEHYEIDVTGRDRDFILDKHGDFLDALQYVIGKIVSRKYRLSKKILVDSDGFRSKRNNELVEIALHAAERVMKMGEDYQLGPLTPYERRLIHVALSNISGVKTFSTGDGFMKKLTISREENE